MYCSRFLGLDDYVREVVHAYRTDPAAAVRRRVEAVAHLNRLANEEAGCDFDVLTLLILILTMLFTWFMIYIYSRGSHML